MEGGGASSSTASREVGSRKRSSKESSLSDGWWDAAGWVCLAGVAAMVLVCAQRGTPAT